jgi:hypothetical protein
MPATLVYNHTEQTMWTRLTSAKTTWFAVDAGTLSSPKEYVHDDTVWATDLTPAGGAAGRVVVTGLAEGSSVAWKFYCGGSVGDIAEARIWGISKIFDDSLEPDATEYLADYLCKLSITSGAKAIGTSAILPTGKFADTITVDEDRSHLPGVRILSNDDDTAAAAVFDALGYWGYIIEISAKTPNTTDWGGLYRVF